MFGQPAGERAGIAGTTQRGAEVLTLPWRNGERA